jgi:hypothetical protein
MTSDNKSQNIHPSRPRAEMPPQADALTDATSSQSPPNAALSPDGISPSKQPSLDLSPHSEPPLPSPSLPAKYRKQPIPPQQFTAICEVIASGLSIRKACELFGLSDISFYGEMHSNPLRAREYELSLNTRGYARGEAVEEIKEQLIAGEIDPMTAKVLIDANKWQASKEQKRVYGEKLDVSGIPAGGATVILPLRERLRKLRRANESSGEADTEQVGDGESERLIAGGERDE